MHTNALAKVQAAPAPRRMPTYGAGMSVEVSALEALLDEVRRTVAHIQWLEMYVGTLSEWEAFNDIETSWGSEQDDSVVKPSPDSLKYIIAVERQKRLNGARARRTVHPAIKQLMAERQHLVSACAVAIRAGVALDSIELAKKQGALVVEAMGAFALSLGADPADAKTIDLMAAALERAL